MSYDSLKWSFSQYNPDRHYKDVRRLLLGVAESVFSMNYNAISDSSLYQESRDKLIKLAHSHNYQVVEINLEADYTTLIERFRERVTQALATPDRKMSNFSEERFQELFNIYQREKNPQAVTYRTDSQSIEEITEQIMKLM